MRMNPADNLDNIDDEYLQILEAMPEKERIRFLLGEFQDVNDGNAYYEFDRDIHVTECKKKQGHTILIGMDFNVQSMTAVCVHIQGDEFHVFEEVFLENLDTPRMIHYLHKNQLRGRIYPDSTSKNRKTSGKSDHDLLKEAGFHIEQTRNPFVTDRVNNINRLLKAGRIKIDPKCRKLINDLEKVVWKDNKLDQKSDPMHSIVTGKQTGS